MCGIAGWVDWQVDLRPQAGAVDKMAQTLAHRGPDGEGSWVSRRAVFAHRRLRVIDLAGGGQPMVHQDGHGATVLSYNGEIYNFLELRRELAEKGHQFTSQSDSEVVLHSYLEWGEACLPRLRGIFAFAIWDEARGELLLARDRLGVKPLVFARIGAGLLFASEPKALLAHPGVRPRVDSAGLAEVVCALPFTPPGRTVYREIDEVEPGTFLICHEAGVRKGQFWSLRSEPHRDNPAETAARLRSLLEAAVAEQLVADVPVAAMLSGGLDSSAVAALASHPRIPRRPDRAFCVDYEANERHFTATPDRPDPDLPFARLVAGSLALPLEVRTVQNEELAANLAAVVRARDKPGFGQIDSALYLLCRAIKQAATVALSGESADEIFGGYAWFHWPGALSAQTFPWVEMRRSSLLAQRSYVSDDLLASVDVDAYIEAGYREALARMPALATESPEEKKRGEQLFLNQTCLLPLLLERMDRMSMAAGVEARVPFCDHRLIEYVWNIPWGVKSNGLEKQILREALAGLLPESVRLRRKAPFPKTQDSAYAALVRARANEILGDPAAAVHSCFKVDQIRCWERDPSTMPGPPPYELIVQTEEWLQSYNIEFVN